MGTLSFQRRNRVGINREFSIAAGRTKRHVHGVWGFLCAVECALRKRGVWRIGNLAMGKVYGFLQTYPRDFVVACIVLKTFIWELE